MFSRNPWPGIGFDAWLLSLDAMTVIALRTMRIAQGGALGDREAQRMVEEKMLAMAMLPFALWSSPTDNAATVTRRGLSHFGKTVRANRRRLSKAA